MCTMFTFSRAFYKANKNAIVDQVINDSFINSEGFSLLTVGEDEENTTLIRSMNIDFILDTLDSLMWGDTADRAWLHLRMATTAFVGVNGCHGFAGNNYSVFHNGILSRPESERFNVDSELIANDLEVLGIDRALTNLAYDTYANVFIVNNKTGTYHVVRRSTGSLYTDGAGNYSSNPVAAIALPVEINTQTHHATPIVWHAPKATTVTGDDKYWNHGWYKSEYEEESDEIKYQIAALHYARTMKDFEEMANYEGWLHQGLPDAIRENLNYKQLGWSVTLGMIPAFPIKYEVDEETEADELEALEREEIEAKLNAEALAAKNKTKVA